ncbi:transmembrane protein 42 [Sitodiplosis mosellana]|uniref:transmembrane protein 42 n=1 Tax=Sitodiplosis mosellana TaxID=263140 RepID=UPI002443C482|nr:transmembrane protein 42 [Sitodiplosis mosellana]
MDLMQLPHFAILSGVFGTAASVFGKFISYSDEFIDNIPVDTSQAELFWRWSLKVVCIGLMVLCNVFVWTFFVKALHQRGGSIVATVTSTATNYCCSAVIGSWIFGETVSSLWWLGTAFVITGLVFVSLGSNDTNDTNESNLNTKKDE